ncbi:MAG TPA: sigma-54 dependent transcriptional regulator [Burkholderiaceae bacterium]|nr:sigma-54 dependent transcriptional regulator [Burkholderiaceae bacterium]
MSPPPAPPLNAAAHDPATPDDNLSGPWPRASVLLVNNEPDIRDFLLNTLAPCASPVLVAASAEAAERLLQRHRFDLVMLESALPERSGIALLQNMRRQGIHSEVVLLTEVADDETAIEALRAGASDLLLKPLRVTQVLHAFNRCLAQPQHARDQGLLRLGAARQVAVDGAPADGMVGQSVAIKGLRAALRRTAAVNSTVLLTGESGAGKDLAAQTLHRLSPRAAGPFVPVNCATLSPALMESELFGRSGGTRRYGGLFMHAQGGTLFLDEIGELPLALQALLLRVLEERRIRAVGGVQEVPVDVRIVAATSRPLPDEVRAGRFREDLYYRLQVVELTLPPLRAHKEDIPELVAHFMATLAPQLGVPPIEVSPGDLADLREHDWPGNVRELRNLVERSLIAGSLDVSALYRRLGRAGTQPGLQGPTDLQAMEKRHILAVLGAVRGDKTQAAQLLGISRRTLERRCAGWAAA